jgi:hypothetical protein
MRGVLVRVGIDQAFGAWNAPVDPQTGEFAYVPIPEGAQRRGLETWYSDIQPALSRFPGVTLPAALASKATHLDPDFTNLTYGDNGIRRGRGLADFGNGDVVAFFAGLRPVRPWRDPLLYALIGVYRVREVVRLETVPSKLWKHNAHTRRVEHRGTDVIVRADASLSGRLRRCIPIGEWRNRAYRIRQDVLEAWGGLSSRDGYVQRSAVPPRLLDPQRFLFWLHHQKPEFIAENNPR